MHETALVADGLDAFGVSLAAAGNALLAPSVTRRLIAQFTRSRPRSSPAISVDLTARETEVWQLVAEGLSNAEIAERLVIGEATVKTHVARLLAKLGLRDRVQAVVLAARGGGRPRAGSRLRSRWDFRSHSRRVAMPTR